ncbi:DUF4258 domain-containing protein [Bergeyella cardium]|uniref:Uncharacterized protein n=1 Tax=Bergeyella cardium TaxID=1585976 RepID=A0A6P1QYD6_9FLAO|nr:DUF4258 domain-containing protein [Bergeyella cardium]QHN65911.1 hypothetical protein DBX24_08470 [Bergeyella cardium]WHE33515.1 DUF4258 domain-containing protein [Bergeyella cardium]WHF60165.1 DUF4258 domain-containing protein [Bergeyella cardium]
MRKLKFYIAGFIPGLLLVFFILNQKGASCSGYLPNSRVIAETLSKKMIYSPEFQTKMQRLGIDEAKVKDSIIPLGEIDFDKSDAQKEPCPEYLMLSPKEKPQYIIRFKKCKDEVFLQTLEKINKK